jgi:hypothetical protein
LSTAFAALTILATYSLLPESLRFSRGVILSGAAFGMLGILLFRRLFIRQFSGIRGLGGNAVVVATEKEYNAILGILEKAVPGERLPMRVSPGIIENNTLCNFAEGRPDLIIFCEGQLPLAGIIAQLRLLSQKNIQFLFHMNGSSSIVGSDIQAATSKVIAPFIGYSLAEPHQQRMKRTMDIAISLLFLVTAPIHLVIHRNGMGLLRNALSVLGGKRTWIGYASGATILPKIKKPVISHMGAHPSFNHELLEKSDNLYAKNYDWWQDAGIVMRHYKELARAT